MLQPDQQPLLASSGTKSQHISYETLSQAQIPASSAETTQSLNWSQNCKNWFYRQRGRIFQPYLIIQGFFCYASVLTFPVLAFVIQDALQLSDFQLALLLICVYLPNLALPQCVNVTKLWIEAPLASQLRKHESSPMRGLAEVDPDAPALVNDDEFDGKVGVTYTLETNSEQGLSFPLDVLQSVRRRAHTAALIISSLGCFAIVLSVFAMIVAFYSETLREQLESGKGFTPNELPKSYLESDNVPIWCQPLLLLRPPLQWMVTLATYYVSKVNNSANEPMGDLKKLTNAPDTVMSDSIEIVQFLRMASLIILVLSRLVFGLSHELLYYSLERLPIYKIMQTDAYYATQPLNVGGEHVDSPMLSSEISMKSTEHDARVLAWGALNKLSPGEILNFATQSGSVLAFYASAVFLAYFVSSLVPVGLASGVNSPKVLLSISVLWFWLLCSGLVAFSLLVGVSVIASFNSNDELDWVDDEVDELLHSNSVTLDGDSSFDSLYNTAAVWYMTGALLGEVLNEVTRCGRRTRKSCSSAIFASLRFFCCFFCRCCACSCLESSSSYKRGKNKKIIQLNAVQPQSANETYRRWLSVKDLSEFERAVAVEISEEQTRDNGRKTHLQIAIQQEEEWNREPYEDTSYYASSSFARSMTPMAGSKKSQSKLSPVLSSTGTYDFDKQKANPFSSFNTNALSSFNAKPLQNLQENEILKSNNEHYEPTPLNFPSSIRNYKEDDNISEYSATLAPSMRLACSTLPVTSQVVHVDGRKLQRRTLYNEVSFRLAEHFRAVRSLVFTCATCIVMQDLYTLVLHRLWGLSLFESVIISSFPSLVGFTAALLNAGASIEESSDNASNDGDSRSAHLESASQTSIPSNNEDKNAGKRSKLHLAFVVIFAYIALMALAQDAENHARAIQDYGSIKSKSLGRVASISSILGHLAPTMKPDSAAIQISDERQNDITLKDIKYDKSNLTADVFKTQVSFKDSDISFNGTLKSYLTRFIDLFTTGELFLLMIAMFTSAVLSSLLQKEQWEVVMKTARVPSLAESVTRHVIAMQSLVYCIVLGLSQFFWKTTPSFVLVIMSSILLIEYFAGSSGR